MAATPTAGETRDVRMRGFSRRSEVDDAWRWIDRHASVLDAEAIAIDDAAGRVLALDVAAALDVPAFDRAAMDGYAVRGDETIGAGEYNPLAFRVIGRALPGQPFEGRVESGQAVRIMTGAPLPAGADAVVPAEYARETPHGVETTMAFGPGKHVGRVGEDIAHGAAVLAAGRRLRPQDAGMLASLGLGAVDVVRRPRVRLVVTGNEVIAPGEPKGLYDIYDANSAMLRSLVARDGALLQAHLRAGDDPQHIRDALVAPGADVVLVSGGTSVGSEDHAPRVLAEAGELAVHGVAMRPSSPAGMGRIGEVLVFLLPGNPVSCLCAYDFFAGRAIRLRGGLPSQWPYAQRRARVARKIASAIGRVDYCRVRLRNGEIEIAMARREVRVRGQPVELTALEFDLLAHFAQHPGHVFSRAQLLDSVWGYSHDGYEHTVTTHINRLRAKLENDPMRPTIILTVRGAGYKLRDSPT